MVNFKEQPVVKYNLSDTVWRPYLRGNFAVRYRAGRHADFASQEDAPNISVALKVSLSRSFPSACWLSSANCVQPRGKYCRQYFNTHTAFWITTCCLPLGSWIFHRWASRQKALQPFSPWALFAVLCLMPFIDPDQQRVSIRTARCRRPLLLYGLEINECWCKLNPPLWLFPWCVIYVLYSECCVRNAIFGKWSLVLDQLLSRQHSRLCF
jgi:hypothetical protein